jgi:hypothetical protein
MGYKINSFLFIGGPLDGSVLELIGCPNKYIYKFTTGKEYFVYEYLITPIEAENKIIIFIYRYAEMRIAELVMKMITKYAE